MHTIPPRDADAYRKTMKVVPEVIERATTEGFSLLGWSAALGALEVVRRGSPENWWVVIIEVVLGVLLYGYLQSKFNKQRMPETPTPDGGIKIHWRWGVAAKSTLLSILCLAVAILFAYFIPQALAESEFVRNLSGCA